MDFLVAPVIVGEGDGDLELPVGAHHQQLRHLILADCPLLHPGKRHDG
jgi:hypothetical protein